MFRRSVDLAVQILLMASLGGQSTGFLFPDILAVRTAPNFDSQFVRSVDLRHLEQKGHHAQSRCKIAVIQAEPFLFANGSGYVPELLRLVGDWYAATSDYKDVFPYDVIPVNTWSQLLTKASASHWNVSYGLVASSLLRNEEPWKLMQASSPTVPTELMMVTSKKITKATNAHATTITTTNTDNATITTTPTSGKSGPTLQPPQLQGKYHVGNRTELKGATILTLDGSPEQRLLKKNPKYRQCMKTVQNYKEALNYVRHQRNVFLLEDSVVTHRHVEQHESELTVVCPKKTLTAGTHQLYYGFFGRDSAIINFLNRALKKITDVGAVKALNSKYFVHTRTCP